MLIYALGISVKAGLIFPAISAHFKVLFNAHAGKYPASLGNMGYAFVYALVCGKGFKVYIHKGYAAAFYRYKG